GVIWTASFATVAIGYLNMISVAFAVLFIGLGIDFGIHFCLRYREEIDRGCENEKALRNSAAGAGLALALCAPTTAVAFYAFIPTAYAGLGQLGLISGTGMFIALAASLTVLPALLTVIPVKPKLRTGDVPAPGRAAAWVRRHGRPISGSALVLGLLALPLIGAARFDIDPMRLRDPGTESVQTVMRLFGDPDSSPYTLQILASGDGAAADLARRLEVLPEVDRAVTLASLIPDDQDEKLEMIDEASLFLMPVFETGEPDAPPGVPERRAALADFGAKLMALEEARASPALLVGGRRLLEGLTRFSSKFSDDENAHAALERALFRFLPHQVDKLGKMLEADYISRSNLPEKLRTRYAEPGGQVRIEVFPSDDVSDQDALRQFVRAVQAVVPDVTGPTVQIVEAGDAVVGSMRQATLWAAILITLFLFVVLRRTRDVLLVLAPLALAGLYTVAATVLLGLSFNFANVIVLPLLIGLGVDGGIHLVMRARERSSDAALLETSTPRAVLLSSLTTIGSFGSLAISSHRGTASMGELLMVAIAITLVCMLIILPAMMVWFESPEDPDRH
ncbi:MAG: MMPL family transporter, partial [Sphingomonadales bacterium]